MRKYLLLSVIGVLACSATSVVAQQSGAIAGLKAAATAPRPMHATLSPIVRPTAASPAAAAVALQSTAQSSPRAFTMSAAAAPQIGAAATPARATVAQSGAGSIQAPMAGAVAMKAAAISSPREQASMSAGAAPTLVQKPPVQRMHRY